MVVHGAKGHLTMIESLLEKPSDSLAELSRNSRAIASRAIAGVYQGKLVFLPGSTNAVHLAMQQLILPELVHLVSQLVQTAS